MNSSRNIAWIIGAAYVGGVLGFIFAPPDVIAQIEFGLVGIVIFTIGAYAILWRIKKLHSSSKE